jgi:CBS domain-containing protein/gamma-glutamyl:cysteine ligase YbdK (ATP-grasp superfamily)
MGLSDVRHTDDDATRRVYVRALLRDLQALERMLRDGLIESGVNRIGAEQEVVLVDSAWLPAPINEAVLDTVNDPHYTTELARFNVEFNLDPLTFTGDCLATLEFQINGLLERLRDASREHRAVPVLTGMLPSLSKDDLSLANITDRPRYHELNRALNRQSGGAYELSLKGLDELNITHDSVMLEACNTSFQVHFQVDPADFARKYNIAQAVAGPVMAVAANSPILFGRRLWAETRIALFEQSLDTRYVSTSLREFQSRVTFGTHWVQGSVIDIFREDVARFRSLFYQPPEEDPIAVLEAGGVPRLSALRLHNGTVYRWNRPCYGISEGRPHLRIENRVLPAGPTVIDQVANAALWFGLMRGVADEYGDIVQHMSFDDAAANFLSAARLGLDAQFAWPRVGGSMPARELFALRLLTLARAGLRSAGINPAHIDRYLSVIEGRVSTGQTGARWALDSLAAMGTRGSRSSRLVALTAATGRLQEEGRPVHEWPLASVADAGSDSRHVHTVGQLMRTDLFTVNAADVIDLAASLMDWKHLLHVPVEDDEHRLVGIVSHRAIMRFLINAAANPGGSTEVVPVAMIMQSNPVTATPAMPTLEAIRLMDLHRITCLPVVDGGRLVGMITERDLMEIARPLLERHLGGLPDQG